ncbi:hypothetical protein NP233_g440 [Leucocoprinus birnbaumii]|uniref:Cation/H+ exchanger transmembrane domain-containing protein n=1 Tax=Leucocoprinus birnbaumii TaxID=56174 RepID=A0AAD5W4B2_9AGAR|nr:hypothetical protein NP233_g440 [Leucocoprinus birnbaumii]
MEGLLEISSPGLAYICIGGFVVLFSTISLLVREKIYVNEVVLGTGFGILAGPLCAGIFDPRSWTTATNRVTLEIMRVVLATGLFAIGVELPKSYMYDHMKGLLVMVVPTMAIGWFIVAALLKTLFDRFDFVTCLAIAACLTPTDPIISAAIVGGNFARKHVPLNIRQIISAGMARNLISRMESHGPTSEAAANDGLAYPFLSISLYLTMEKNRWKCFWDWILIGWIYEVFLGILIGVIIGYLFSHIMTHSHKRGYINRESYVAQYLALSIFTMGVANTIGSDDLLAAFAAGSAISWDGDFNTRTEGEAFASVIEYILNCGCFFYIGAWLPWGSFTIPELGISPWKLLILCIGILLLRRIPAILTLYRWVPEIANWREALFCGHFGPMGVGAIFISTLAVHRLPDPQSPPQSQADILAISLHPVVGFVVFVSILVHGLSIPFFNVVQSQKIPLPTSLGSQAWTLPSSIQPLDWLFHIHRAPADPALPVHGPSIRDYGSRQFSVHTQDGSFFGPADMSTDPAQSRSSLSDMSLDTKRTSGQQTPIVVRAHINDVEALTSSGGTHPDSSLNNVENGGCQTAGEAMPFMLSRRTYGAVERAPSITEAASCSPILQ